MEALAALLHSKGVEASDANKVSMMLPFPATGRDYSSCLPTYNPISGNSALSRAIQMSVSQQAQSSPVYSDDHPHLLSCRNRCSLSLSDF